MRVTFLAHCSWNEGHSTALPSDSVSGAAQLFHHFHTNVQRRTRECCTSSHWTCSVTLCSGAVESPEIFPVSVLGLSWWFLEWWYHQQQGCVRISSIWRSEAASAVSNLWPLELQVDKYLLQKCFHRWQHIQTSSLRFGLLFPRVSIDLDTSSNDSMFWRMIPTDWRPIFKSWHYAFCWVLPTVIRWCADNTEEVRIQVDKEANQGHLDSCICHPMIGSSISVE